MYRRTVVRPPFDRRAYIRGPLFPRWKNDPSINMCQSLGGHTMSRVVATMMDWVSRHLGARGGGSYSNGCLVVSI